MEEAAEKLQTARLPREPNVPKEYTANHMIIATIVLITPNITIIVAAIILAIVIDKFIAILMRVDIINMTIAITIATFTTTTVDDINPALPIARNIPYFP